MIKAEFQSPLCRENATVKSLDQQPCSVQNNRLCTGSARCTNSCPWPAVTHKRLATQEKKLLKNNDGVGYSANSIYLLHITHLHACWNSAGLGSCRKDLYRDKAGLGCSDSRALKEKLPRSSSESRLGLASTAHGQKKTTRTLLLLLSALPTINLPVVACSSTWKAWTWCQQEENHRLGQVSAGLCPTELPTAPSAPYMIQMLPLISPLSLC